MRIALAQVCTTRDVGANLDLVAHRVAAAADRQARLVVFPEATMRAFGHNLASVAEPLHGPFATRVSELAASYELTIVVGMFTPGTPREGRPRVRNTLLAADPSGRTAAYHKMHLFDAFGFAESDSVEAGEDEIRIEADGTTIGLTTCYDVRFPQLFINHARAGAEVIIVATSWGAGEGKRAQWDVLTKARALDSTCWILACAQADPAAAGVVAKPGAPTGIGYSRVVSPTGEVVAAAGPGPELVVADIDPTAVERARRIIPVLANSRLG